MPRLHHTYLRAIAARLLLVVAMALLSGFVTAGPRVAMAADVIATGARVGGDETRTRFVADLNRPVGFTVYVMPDPYRVMIDMSGVKFDLAPDVGQESRGLISSFRFGEVENGRSRIVIDTKWPVLIEKSFIVEPQAGQPARVVVDLVKTSKEAFLKAYKAGQQKPASDVADLAEQNDGTESAGEADDVTTAALAPRPRQKPVVDDAADTPVKKPSARADGRRLVVIDPGHGGIDPGAIGVGKTKEKDVVLAFGHALRKVLEKNGSYKVVMTRTEDEFLRLRERVRVARDNEADLFIAIHADKVRGQSARGATIYTLSERASDAEAEELAHKENRADIIGGVDLGDENEMVTDILIDLALRESKNHAVFFAKKAVAEMKGVTRFTGKPMRSAGFVVLKNPDVPSVLIELGYLSSRQDEAQLTSAEWRGRVAESLASAIDKYFELQVAARAQ